jgi:hypothetical protein
LKELENQSEKQIFYLTPDNRVYTKFDKLGDKDFEVCYGMLDLVCSALLSDKNTAKLGKAIIAFIVIAILYFTYIALFN